MHVSDSDDDPFDALGGGKARREAKSMELRDQGLAVWLDEPKPATDASSDARALLSPCATTATPGRGSTFEPSSISSVAAASSSPKLVGPLLPEAPSRPNDVAVASAQSPTSAYRPSGLPRPGSATTVRSLGSPYLKIATDRDVIVAPRPPHGKPSAMAARQALASARNEQRMKRYREEEERHARLESMLRPGVPKELPAYGDIVDEAHKATSGDLVIWQAHCMQIITDRMLQATACKIGITSCPKHRWLNFKYGYYPTESWRWMHLLFESPAAHAKSMEKHLIAWAKEKYPVACTNQKPGGDGVAKDSSSYLWTYAVFDDNGPSCLRSNARLMSRHHLMLCDTCQRYLVEAND